MKRILCRIISISIIAATLFNSACTKDDSQKPEWPLNTSHTLMLYLIGTDLNGAFNTNIIQTKNALCELSKRGGPLTSHSNKPRVVCFRHTDGMRRKGEIVELVYSNGQCAEKTYATYDIPSWVTPEDMARYLQDMMQAAPAQSYGLIIGSHGRGWIPLESADFYQSASAERIKAITSYWQTAPDALPTRFVGEGYPFFESYSEGEGNIFNITDIADAIATTGERLKYLIFDACLMASVETMYDLRNSADYIIASVVEIMKAGFPYDVITPCLLADKGRHFDLDGVCYAFNELYQEAGYSGSISLIDCSELEALAECIKIINIAYPVIDDQKLKTVQYYDGLRPHLFYDLGDYINKTCIDENLKARFNAQIQRTVPSKYTLSKFYTSLSPYNGIHDIDIEGYSGLSTSQPSTMYRTEYMNTSWYKATH